MAKETVRYPDALVARIEAFVTDSSAFESKSEYHRFASEYLLSLLDPNHDPSVLGYDEIFEDLTADLAAVQADTEDENEPFLETYIHVRRHLLHGEREAARAAVDEAYDVTDREALLLDELIGRSGHDSHASSVESHPGGPTVNGQSEPRDGQSESQDGQAAETAGETNDDSADRNRPVNTRPPGETPVESDT